MVRYNLVAGACVGLAAALIGLVFEPTVQTKLAEELAEREHEVPEVLNPDGTIKTPKRTIINEIDRAEIGKRLESYRQGSRYLIYNAFAMLGLGIISTYANRGTQLAMAGGAGFTASTILVALGPIAAGIWNLPMLTVLMPIGALAFTAGWICLVFATILIRSS